MPRVAVVIAALNEEGSLGDVLAEIPATACGLPMETIVVDDGSTDRTAEIARAAGVHVHSFPSNRGHGVALREGYRIAHDISAYSFPAMAKAALPYLRDKSALLTLTYLGSERALPNYNTMGLAKASLEASVRYLAESLGKKGVRVNGISAGPIKTLAASGIKDFGKILNFVKEHAPLRRNVTIEDVGNTAAFLLSDLAGGITGEITYVDGGFSHVVGGMAE